MIISFKKKYVCQRKRMNMSGKPCFCLFSEEIQPFPSVLENLLMNKWSELDCFLSRWVMYKTSLWHFEKKKNTSKDFPIILGHPFFPLLLSIFDLRLSFFIPFTNSVSYFSIF
jgi:hypothetical protein